MEYFACGESKLKVAVGEHLQCGFIVPHEATNSEHCELLC